MGNQGGGRSVSTRDAQNIARAVDQLSTARGAAPAREKVKELSKALLKGTVKKPTDKAGAS
jgi:hypothetical protein